MSPAPMTVVSSSPMRGNAKKSAFLPGSASPDDPGGELAFEEHGGLGFVDERQRRGGREVGQQGLLRATGQPLGLEDLRQPFQGLDHRRVVPSDLAFGQLPVPIRSGDLGVDVLEPVG